jgi:hypothetical protein
MRVLFYFWLNIRLFPFSHVPSRFLNIISLSESSPQVRDESSRGLRPFSVEPEGWMVKSDSTAAWPNFSGESIVFLFYLSN